MSFFTDDIYDFGSVDPDNIYNPGDDEEHPDFLGPGTQTFDIGGTDDYDTDDHEYHFGRVPPPPVAGSSARDGRRRGRRGGGSTSSKASSTSEKKPRLRGGQVPHAPEFSGDIERDPLCLRKYRHRLLRWVRLTRELLPPAEQGLRARDKVTGDAEIELEDISDDRFDCIDGIKNLLADFEEPFGEREVMTRANVIKEYESVTRVQGESVHAFVRRFRQIEMKLKDHKVPAYPDETRAIKLMTGLRLDEKANQMLLTSAGNVYDFNKIKNAIKIQYPFNTTVTGATLPSKRHNNNNGYKGKGGHRPASGGKGFRRRPYSNYPAEYENGEEGAEDGLLPIEEEPADGQADEGYEYVEDYDQAAADEEGYDPADYDQAAADDQQEEPDASALLADCANALTMTADRLKGLTQSRGYFKPKGGGKGGGKGKKGGGKSKSGGKTGGKAGGAKARGKGDHRPSPAPNHGNLNVQRNKLKGTTGCLNCGDLEHWIKDCPKMNNASNNLADAQQVMLASGSVILDASGDVATYGTYMVACEVFTIGSDDDTNEPNNAVQLFDSGYTLNSIVPTLQVHHMTLTDENVHAFMIADTGCQRMVAGPTWHKHRNMDIAPWQARVSQDMCRFTFGPSVPVTSYERRASPTGLAGVLGEFRVSYVTAHAPGLFSRDGFVIMDAVPDVVQGLMHWRSLNRSSVLYLCNTGHLAFRIDEWPEQVEQHDWPFTDTNDDKLDVYFPTASAVTAHPLPDVGSSGPTKRPLSSPSDCQPLHYASHSSTNMVDSMALSADQSHRVCGESGSGGPPLCSNLHASQSQGQSRSSLSLGQHLFPNDDDGRSVNLPGHTGQSSLSTEPSKLPARNRPSILRRRRSQHSDVRHVRLAMGDGQGEEDLEASGSQSKPKRQDATRSASYFPSIPRVIQFLAFLFAAIGSILLAAAPRLHQREAESAGEALAANSASDSDEEYPPTVKSFRMDRGGTVGGRSDHDRGEPGLPGGGLRGRTAGVHGGGRPTSLPGQRRSLIPQNLTYSCHHVLTCQDTSGMVLKEGTRRRLKGDVRKLSELLACEQKIYAARCEQSINLRKHKADVLEIYGGMAHVTLAATGFGLRALQPVDKSHDFEMQTKAQLDLLHHCVLKQLPHVVFVEIMCTDWCSIQNLNYYWRPEELEQRRKASMLHVNAMSELILDLVDAGCHVVLENPSDSELWNLPPITRLVQDSRFKFVHGHMCCHGLRGSKGLLIKKPTGWLTTCDELANVLQQKCSGDHEHEPCLGYNAKRGQVYTPLLARRIIHGIIQLLKNLGDPRFAINPASLDERHAWVVQHAEHWVPPGEQRSSANILFLDADKTPQTWMPILQEADKRLSGRATASAIVKPTAPLHVQIQRLVPWKLTHVQMYRLPKRRRLPMGISLDSFTHRAAALLFTDGTVMIETEPVDTIAGAPSQMFDRPVLVAIFIYGTAPETAIGPADNEPETASPAKDQPPASHDSDDETKPWEPGAKDITFPGITNNMVPSWVKAVLRRIHVNTGHSSSAAMCRQLATAGASGQALMGARGLRCQVCFRMRPPRQPKPSKHWKAKRFNDRVMCDIIYPKDVAGVTYIFLSMVDDATTLHVLKHLDNREPHTLIQAMVDAWFTPFGLPDELLLDAEGGWVADKFAEFIGISGLKVRFVPADAHWQLGKAERHGFAVMWIMDRLVSQFGLCALYQMVMVACASTHAKNTLARRSGSSPCQWVYGRNPKLPAALLSEPDNPQAMDAVSQSQQLQDIEAVRFAAMKAHLDFEADQGLRDAMLRKGRPWRGPFEPGQKIAFHRKTMHLAPGQSARARRPGQDMAGYIQGMIISVEPGPSGSLWVRTNQGRLVAVAREQARTVEGEELWTPSQDDLTLLRHVDKDLTRQPFMAHDLRQPNTVPLDEHSDLPVPLPVILQQGPSADVSVLPPEAPVSDIVVPPALDADGELSSPAPVLASVPEDNLLPEVHTPPALHAPADLEPEPTAVVATPDTSFTAPSDRLSPSASVSSLPVVPDPMPISDDRVPALVRSRSEGEITVPPTKRLREATSANVLLTACDDQEIQWQYDNKTKTWRKSSCKSTALPSNEVLNMLSKLKQPKWHDDEVIFSKNITNIPKSKQTTSATHPCRSVAVKQKQDWKWLQLFDDIQVGSETALSHLFADAELSPDCDEVVAFYHQSKEGHNLEELSVNFVDVSSSCMSAHINSQDVWLCRLSDGKDQDNCGWDGSAAISAFFNNDSFEYIAWHAECVEEGPLFNALLADASSKRIKAKADQIKKEGWLSSSEDEDGNDGSPNLTRAQKKALLRELPWKTIEQKDRAAFIDACIKEWKEWQRWSSVRKLSAAESRRVIKSLILPSRLCYRWKPLDGGLSYKAKARLVLLGFRDPHLPLLARDAPVLARHSLLCLLQWAACFKLDLHNADAKSAFLQGKPDDERPEPIYMQSPKDAIAREAVPEWDVDPPALYEMVAPGYGQANAPRRWYLSFRDRMFKLHWELHTLDPCLFLFRSEGLVVGMLGVHVDDIIAAIFPEHVSALHAVRDEFEWGSEWCKNDFIFTGRHIKRNDDGSIDQDQGHYCSELDMRSLKEYEDTMCLLLDPALVTEFRSCIGSLQWLSGITRPDVAADTSLLQDSMSKLTVADLKEVQRSLKYAKATATASIHIHHIDPEDLVFIAFSDAAWANAPGARSQAGMLICACSKNVTTEEVPASILEWKSHRLKRACRSTLGAEAAALDAAADHASYFGCLFSELLFPDYRATLHGASRVTVIPVTDCKSLFDAVHRLATSFEEKRVQIDVTSLRTATQGLRWLPTDKMQADVFTKRCAKLRNEFRKFMCAPRLCLVETKDAQEESIMKMLKR
jgi:hypothetical protein